MRFYTGIGSRETPPDICEKMSQIAELLRDRGYTLRSGGAKGADRAFEKNLDARDTNIYLPNSTIPGWCFEEVQKYVPSNRNWNSFNEYTKRLLARDMLQIYGHKDESISEFVICWTKDGKDSGGTGYALRAAIANNIKIYNLHDEKDTLELESFLIGL